MSAASVLRAGAECLELWSERVPPLIELGAKASATDDAAAGRFRDELIAIARGSSEIAARQLRRGLDDLDAFTRSHEGAAEQPRPGGPANDGPANDGPANDSPATDSPAT